jgi:hypothetical protein
MLENAIDDGVQIRVETPKVGLTRRSALKGAAAGLAGLVTIGTPAITTFAASPGEQTEGGVPDNFVQDIYHEKARVLAAVARMKAKTVEVASSHASPVSRPRDVARLILAAARSATQV